MFTSATDTRVQKLVIRGSYNVRVSGRTAVEDDPDCLKLISGWLDEARLRVDTGN